jgi:Lrp/AsnC family transcriptional regulator
MSGCLEKSFRFRQYWDNFPIMTDQIDRLDRSILRALQRDAALPVEAVAEKVGLSRNACWRRIKRLEETGVIRARVALVDAEAVDLGQTVMVLIRTNAHDPDWLKRFRAAVIEMPEVLGAYRMSGDLDYLLKVCVRDVKSYDRFYQRLIAKVPVANVSASFVMEDIKDTTALPIT